LKVLVIGGNGFIGSYIVEQLVQLRIAVRVFGRSANKYAKELDIVEYFYGDIQDKKEIESALIGIDIVCHTLSPTVPSTSNLNPIFDAQSNLISTLNILELMREKGLKRIIYLSSGGTVYGNPITYPTKENHPTNPLCSYGIIKLAVEKYLLMYEELHGFEPIIFRLSNVYGKRQRIDKPQGVIARFAYSLIENQPISIWGDGSIRRDYINVQDVSRIVVKGIQSAITGAYNIGAGEDHSIKEIVDCIEQVANKKFVINYEEARNFDVPKVRLDISKVKADFNWTPKVKLIEGIQLQYDWMKEYFDNKNRVLRLNEINR